MKLSQKIDRILKAKRVDGKFTVNEFIGRQIVEARIIAGMTQGELSKAVGHSSAAYISFIETGERRIKAEDLLKASRVLGQDISFFFPTESGEKLEPKKPLETPIKLACGECKGCGGHYLMNVESILGDPSTYTNCPQCQGKGYFLIDSKFIKQ